MGASESDDDDDDEEEDVSDMAVCWVFVSEFCVVAVNMNDGFLH